MTSLCASINSQSLGIKTNVRVLLPDITAQSAPPADGYAVLYLLHGYTGDSSDWLRVSRLEYYLAQKPLVVVMPDGGKGFYTDTASGDAYWTFLSQELPQWVQSTLPVTRSGARTFAAGLSMGGYGAVKLALRCPQQYARAISFSGVLDVADTMQLLHHNPSLIPNCNVPPNFAAIFGDPASLAQNKNDLLALLRLADVSHCPQLHLFCGEQDFLFAANQRFAAIAQEKGVLRQFEHFPGAHEWNFWDAALQLALAQLPV